MVNLKLKFNGEEASGADKRQMFQLERTNKEALGLSWSWLFFKVYYVLTMVIKLASVKY